MKKKIGEVLIDLYPPEKPKFRSPLILTHDLWSGSWCWQQWATRFCNLGWECWAVNFRGRTEEKALEALGRLTFDDCLGDLKQVIRATPGSPVLLGHGLGGLVAAIAAEGEKISALAILSSPFPSTGDRERLQGLRLLRLKYLPLIFLGRSIRIQEKDFCSYWLASLPENRRVGVLPGVVPESGYLVGELFKPRVSMDPSRVRCPVLVLGGSDDRVVPLASLRKMAQHLGAELKEYRAHGHWMVQEEGWEEVVDDIHRWLVQRLGEKILLAEFT